MSGLRVVSERGALAHEWDAMWSACPHATYFHSREWSELWATYTDGDMRPAARLVTFSDGATVILSLTRQRLRRGLRSRWLSAPAGTFGGWLSDGDGIPLSREHALALHALMTRGGELWWRLNPYDPLAAELASLADEYDDTHVLELTHGVDSTCERGAHGHLTSVRKAVRAGVVARKATSLDDWRAYYAVYEDSLRRWGDNASSSYGWPLFKAMFERGSRHIDLWLAELDDVVIGGGICLSAGRHVAYWHAASLSSHFSFRPANLLVDAMVNDACAREMTWFDFNPSGGHEGVRIFKERCGATPIPSPIFCRRHANHRWTGLLPGLGGLSWTP